MAYFKVEDKDLNKRIQEYLDNIARARKEAIDFVKEYIPAASEFKNADLISSVGGVRAVKFPNGIPPEAGWVKDSISGHRFFRPSKTHKNTESIRIGFRILPRVSHSWLNLIVRYDPEISLKLEGREYCAKPPMLKQVRQSYLEDDDPVFMYSLPQSLDPIYNAPDGIVEITYSEFKNFTS